jgi:hypothetical protein
LATPTQITEKRKVPEEEEDTAKGKKEEKDNNRCGGRLCSNHIIPVPVIDHVLHEKETIQAHSRIRNATAYYSRDHIIA